MTVSNIGFGSLAAGGVITRIRCYCEPCGFGLRGARNDRYDGSAVQNTVSRIIQVMIEYGAGKTVTAGSFRLSERDKRGACLCLPRIFLWRSRPIG